MEVETETTDEATAVSTTVMTNDVSTTETSEVTTSIVNTPESNIPATSNIVEGITKEVSDKTEDENETLYIVLPLLVVLLILCFVFILKRSKAKPSARYRQVLALLRLPAVPSQQDLRSPGEPDSDPPPDYAQAVCMSSPEPMNPGLRYTAEPQSPTSDVFRVEITDSVDSGSDEDTENGHEDEISDIDANADVEVKCGISVTTEAPEVVNGGTSDTNNSANNEVENLRYKNQSATSSSNKHKIKYGPGHKQKKHNLKVIIVDLHKMSYDPQHSPGHLPSYDEYVQEFLCVHL